MDESQLLSLYDFKQISLTDEAFDMFDSALPAQENKHGYCPDCDIPMNCTHAEYQCAQCGRICEREAALIDHEQSVASSIRIATGANKGRFYNVATDYTKTQFKIVLDQLVHNQSAYTGMAFPLNILTAAATQYNNLQKYITEDDIDADGAVKGQKKFVRRGNIKDEVLAGLIYFEGIRERLVRKKRDIAVFMRLPTFGFSRGEDILRNLHAECKLDIPVDDEPIEGYVDRYMEALSLENPTHTEFVIAVVDLSERRKIGMNSQLSSKIVGTIWLLITRCRLKITPTALEKATDNTKRNTFMKFYTLVTQNMRVFEPLFVQYGIPTK